MARYPQFSLDYIRFELPVAQGWAYYGAALLMDPWLQFCGLSVQNGYCELETQRLMKTNTKPEGEA